MSEIVQKKLFQHPKFIKIGNYVKKLWEIMISFDMFSLQFIKHFIKRVVIFFIFNIDTWLKNRALVKSNLLWNI